MVKALDNPALELAKAQTENQKLADYSAILRRKYTLNNKVLLIQPPQFILDTFNPQVAKERGCYAYPPTGLQCIAKALAERNLKVEILDLNYLLLKRIKEDDSFQYSDWLILLDEYLSQNTPSVIGVTCISVYTDVFKDTHPLTVLLRHLRKKDRHIIIAGGTIATNEYEEYLKKELCHFVVEGEGENKAKFLFDYLYDCEKYTVPTPGIYFKYQEFIEETAGLKDVVELKGNLIETYKNIPIEDYCNVGSLNPFSRMAGQDKPFAPIQLTRGCRANCKFCGVIEFMGGGLRQYPAEDLLEEINYLIKERGIRHFEVLDDDFLGDRNCQPAVFTLLNELAGLKKRYPISWAAGNGLIAASLNEKLLNLMRDSGCIGFRVGIESGNEEMLRRMRKPTSLAILKKVGKILQDFPEFFVGGNYIIGLFAEETFKEMLDTFRFACKIGLDWAAFTAFQFTSKAKAETEKFRMEGRLATDFIPPKDASSRQIIPDEKIISGPEVFGLPKDAVPCAEQIKEIWFAFNLVANYLNNKNLKSDGRPEKFVSWIEAVQLAYPQNPYMPLFTGLGHVLLGNRAAAQRSLKKTKENLGHSGYWRERFRQFALNELVDNFPLQAKETRQLLGRLRGRYAEWIK